MGNVIGSNIANLFLIISLCAIIKPLVIKKETKYIENQIVILCTGVFYLIVNNNGAISRYEGIALLLMCLLYIFYNIVMAKVGVGLEYEKASAEIENNENNEKIIENQVEDKRVSQTNNEIKEKRYNELKNSLTYSIIQIIIGIIGLKFGGDFVVDNAVLIAESLGISEKLISLTIVAFGTSLPELITCISATRRDESDLAIGNIIGSQIFNILLIVGLSATVAPIQGVIGYIDELTILLIGNIIFAILPFIGQKDKIGRVSGFAFVSFYIVYMINLVFSI